MSYIQNIKKIVRDIPVKNGIFLITGATGLIGSCIIDILLEANEAGSKNIIYGMSRSEKRLKQRFGNKIIPVIQDIREPLCSENDYDFILHCASNADPRSYATRPVETILTNIVGSHNILDYCKRHLKTRMLFTSSFEVYGNIEGTSVYSEEMSGIIDQTVLRNGYPESKRCSELLLRSYVDEYNVDAMIARLPSVYGPTMLKLDSKAHAQFIRNALNKENIVLKSKGEQIRSYCYVLDVASALFNILFKGKAGEIYNVSNEQSIVSIAEVAKVCADIAGTNVVFDVPDAIESRGFSKSKNCILDNKKIKALGWNAQFTLNEGLMDTIEELKKTCRSN